ncbi:SigE family RNA polymerase sigma factor [Blastococcus sp. CT_GayMR20]|jgi:RNA polymerase sigma-70 factor (sigma-E family)|uniref:SigE family RNA polymerase sigma factor n=1 Tax=Blastococcus sp. CT_GayMR20 TaxID=2559609 RepID=UPI0010736AC9|nr:SigE family RNA polymerase sigma factor [Blastococcus sp. CT_GayMR20]TFV88078.1 SigE family RNA polymerase sigma factor [Blastococcus sp. CT_GayMR20]
MAARDETGFEDFVAARSADLLRTCVLLTRDRGHAEDLLQTALVKAYRRWGRISRDDPYPYVRRILVTTAASWRRLRSTQEIVSLPAYDPPGPDPTEAVAERERLAAALATLPARMRTVLVLRYAEDHSEAATAELMGCSVATVKSQTVRGLARLRTVLGDTALITVPEES